MDPQAGQSSEAPLEMISQPALLNVLVWLLCPVQTSTSNKSDSALLLFPCLSHMSARQTVSQASRRHHARAPMSAAPRRVSGSITQFKWSAAAHSRGTSTDLEFVLNVVWEPVLHPRKLRRWQQIVGGPIARHVHSRRSSYSYVAVPCVTGLGAKIPAQPFAREGLKLLADMADMADMAVLSMPLRLPEQTFEVAGRKCDFRVYLYIPTTVPLVAFYSPVPRLHWFEGRRCASNGFHYGATMVPRRTFPLGILRVARCFTLDVDIRPSTSRLRTRRTWLPTRRRHRDRHSGQLWQLPVQQNHVVD